MKKFERLSLEYQSYKKSPDYKNKSELKEIVWRELSPYFSNKNNFELCFSLNQIITEYNLFVSNKDNPYFLSAFNSFFSIYKEAKINNFKITFQILSEELSSTSKAIQNYAEVGNLEQDKNVERLDLFAKLCFRDIGDILEGSIKEFAKLIFILSGGNESHKGKDKTSFGSMINVLLKKGLESCYIFKPYNITINQLRNISYHKDYVTDNEKKLIICKYASNKLLELTKDQLLDIAIMVNKLYLAHKVSYEFFLMDNISEINSSNQEINITEDSVIITIYEIAYSYGFKVTESDLSPCIGYIKIVEFKRYSSDIYSNTRAIAMKICQLLGKDINFEIIPIFDIPPFNFKTKITTTK